MTHVSEAVRLWQARARTPGAGDVLGETVSRECPDEEGELSE